MVRDPYFESRNPYFDGNGSILIWTDYLGSPNWGYYDANFQIEGQVDCKEKCYVTMDKSYLEKASAVVFSYRDIDLENLPKKKVEGQKWILYIIEPPNFSFYFYTNDSIENMTRKMWKKMDLLMSYRIDGDIYTPYGGII